MADNTIITGAMIAGAILLNGYLAKDEGRYELSASGTGQTAWRINVRTGQTSMCGSLLEGSAFSRMKMQQDEALLSAAQGASQDVRTKVIQDSSQFHNLANPRCTEWMSAD
jgi:hypothetical protein